MIKHATAGAFLFHQDSDTTWRLGLIQHPRLNRWMVPGGHVEDDESQFEAALREVQEETGLDSVEPLEAAAPQFPAGFPKTHSRVPLPWWITEVVVAPDNHLNDAHIHVDHQYVAVVTNPLPSSPGAHPFAWFTGDQAAELAMFEDSKVLAKMLFLQIEELTAGEVVRLG